MGRIPTSGDERGVSPARLLPLADAEEEVETEVRDEEYHSGLEIGAERFGIREYAGVGADRFLPKFALGEVEVFDSGWEEVLPFDRDSAVR